MVKLITIVLLVTLIAAAYVSAHPNKGGSYGGYGGYAKFPSFDLSALTNKFSFFGGGYSKVSILALYLT